MYFNRKNKPRSQIRFFVGFENIKVVPKYKHLGTIPDEFSTILADSAGRAFCAIISRIKQLKGCE